MALTWLVSGPGRFWDELPRVLALGRDSRRDRCAAVGRGSRCGAGRRRCRGCVESLRAAGCPTGGDDGFHAVAGGALAGNGGLASHGPLAGGRCADAGGLRAAATGRLPPAVDAADGLSRASSRRTRRFSAARTNSTWAIVSSGSRVCAARPASRCIWEITCCSCCPMIRLTGWRRTRAWRRGGGLCRCCCC